MSSEHHRVSKAGKRLGAFTHKMYLIGEQVLREHHEPIEDCCDSCAFLRGSVPNGCAQTQLDAVKAVMETVPFMCHMSPNKSEVCKGWFAAVQARKHAQALGIPIVPTNYNFSPPDESK